MKKSLNVFLVLLLILSSVPDITIAENEELIEEYKLYAEKADDKVLIYSDETLEDELYELEEDISVLVTKEDIDASLEEEHDFVYITLNPESEEIPEELVDEIEKVEDIQGFVYIDTLVELEDEAIFLEEREAENEGSEEIVEEAENNEQNESESDIEDEEQEDQSEEQDESESVIEDEEQEDQSEEQDESELEKQDENEDLEEDNKEEDISVMRRSTLKESKTSQLAHIYGGDRLIYKTLGGNSFKATSQYQNAAYYVKREAQVGAQKYYLLSKSPSATRGVVGWMKAEDISTRTHSGVTNAKKQLRIKGIGKATSKAWGGSKDTVHNSMSRFKGQSFHVNLTEKVGSNTWYRGKINGKGADVWLHSSQTQKLQIKESKTSQLAHIYGGSRLIYKTLGGNSFKATSQYQNAAYYVKREAQVGAQKYYLLSKSPSATRGVVGWMKAEDVSTRTHSGVTNAKKQLTLKGTGKATSKAWGGSKDMVHSSMSRFKGQTFHVNLTEKVGSNTWYRGKINGKGADVWLHSSQTQKLQIKESKTSQLAHIYGGDRLIYKTLGGNSFKATGQYQNVAYYVKREAEVGGQKYYLLSKSPSATRGVVGWMKAEDVSTRTHSGVTNAKKQLAIKGPGKATSKAWGGSKDTVYSSMSRFKGQTFHVNLTEKVGDNTWNRGKINGKGANVWLHSSQTTAYTTTKTNYGLSLDEALAIQGKPERSPFVLNGSHGFIAKSRVDKNNRLKSSSYVRTMPQTGANPDNKIIKTLAKGTKITPIKGGNDHWDVIEVGGSRKVTALSHQIKERLDPKNSINHAVNKFQFLDLRKQTGLTTGEMNRELATRGILRNQGKAFRDASIKHGINEMYLIVHARLETGNGTSALSTGKHEVGLDSKGKPHLVKTTADRIRLKNIKKTYNMFGIGAIDTDPAGGGATRAYTEGWFTPEAAIVGGAAWIKDNYIYNKHNQNTLYKMRWNPNMKNGFAWKQYATDIDWALKQAKLIHGVYNHTDKNKSLTFDIPKY